MDNSYQHSTIAQILENILEEFTFEGESKSKIADILLSILNHTEYNEDTNSVIAELLVKLKAKIEGAPFAPYDGDSTSNIADIIISILEETEYNKPPRSRIAELLLELKEKLEEFTEITVSGAIASFITNVALPIVYGKFSIVAQEVGTGEKSPTNPYTLIGYNSMNISKVGSNVWDEQWINGYYDINTGEYSFVNTRICNKTPIRVVPNQSYYLVVPYANTYVFDVVYYDKNMNYIGYKSRNARSFVAPANCYFINFSAWTVYGNIYNNDISINYPITDTKYHAYQGATFPVTWETEAGIIYGGYYESVSGLLIATVKGFNIGSANWIKSSSYNSVFYTDIIGGKGGRGKYDSTIFTYDGPCTGITDAYNRGNLKFANTVLPDQNIRAYFRYDAFSTETAATFAETFANEKILYPLANPQTFQLSPVEIETLLGQNNIYNDTNGDTEITFLYQGTP